MAWKYVPLFVHVEQALTDSKPSDWPLVLGELERLRTQMLTRMLGNQGSVTRQGAPPTEDEPLLTLPQVAERLAIPTGHAYALARRGELPTVQIGKYVRVSRAALASWIAQHATKRGLERKGTSRKLSPKLPC